MKHVSLDWRDILARLPLPMLALAAAHGVYQFSLLFTPQWVAVAQAAAFEATYTGLAAQRNLSDAQRKRARVISLGAVVVSVLYNALSGYFHRNPDVLTHAPFALEVILAALHGAPLAIVAYAVSDLLLHTEARQTIALPTQSDRAVAHVPARKLRPAPRLRSRRQGVSPIQVTDTRRTIETQADQVRDTPVPHGEHDKIALARRLREQTPPTPWREVERIVGISNATLRRQLAKQAA